MEKNIVVVVCRKIVQMREGMRWNKRVELPCSGPGSNNRVRDEHEGERHKGSREKAVGISINGGDGGELLEKG